MSSYLHTLGEDIWDHFNDHDERFASWLATVSIERLQSDLTAESTLLNYSIYNHKSSWIIIYSTIKVLLFTGVTGGERIT